MPTPERPLAEGYGVNVGDEWYRLAANPQMPLNIYTKDSLAQRSVEEPGFTEETVLDVGYAFSRSDLTGGEGLDHYPRKAVVKRDPRDLTRFWDSANFISSRPDGGQPSQLTMVKSPEIWWTAGGNIVDMGTGGEQLYVAVGTNVTRYSDLIDTTADDTDNIGTTITMMSVDTDGTVAVRDTDGDINYKPAVANTYLEIYSSATDGPMLDAQAVWLAKGRVLAYCDDLSTAGMGILLEIGPVITGTPAAPTEGTHTYTTVDTFPCQMLDCADAGHAIVGAFSDGSIRSYVPMSDAAGDTPVLTIRGRTQMPVGETPYRLAYNAGTLLVWTLDGEGNVRLYTALVLDDRFDYVTGQLQLIRTWNGTAETWPAYTANAVSTRDSIYFWMEESGSADWNLWRFDLVTTGLFRERDDSWDARPVGSVIFEDSVVFGRSTSVYRDSANYEGEAWLITPNIDFGLNTDINFTAFVVEVFSMEGGATVELYRSTNPEAILDRNHASWTLITTLNDIAQSGVEQTRVNVTSSSLALKIEARAVANDAPVITHIAMRAIPKHRDWIAELPINISDWIEAPGRRPTHHPNLGDQVLATALTQQGQSTTMHLLNPDITLIGIVHNLGIPITYTTSRGSQGRFMQMVFLGRLYTEESQTTALGTEGLGIDLLGDVLLGGEDS